MLKRVLLALGLMATGSCGDPQSPQAQITQTLERMEIAAEARDVGDLMDFVSENYRDAYGRGREDLARYARGYFIANQSIHLLARIDSVQFPTETEARATVLVGMVGREAGASATWDLAADLYEFEVALAREGSDWRVTHAKWQRAGGGRP